MAEKVRPERVAEEFREILAEEIPRLKDPRVGFVTLTRVVVGPDLRKATVFYTVLGESHRANQVLHALEPRELSAGERVVVEVLRATWTFFEAARSPCGESAGAVTRPGCCR